jgi:hypothetical protein
MVGWLAGGCMAVVTFSGEVQARGGWAERHNSTQHGLA